MAVEAATRRIDDRDWSALTLGERIRQIEVEGYLVLPDLLSPEQVTELKASRRPGRPSPPTTARASRFDPAWSLPAA